MGKVYFRCEYSNYDILEYEKPVSYTTACRVFKRWANESRCTGRIYAGNKFIRTTGTAWQLPPRRREWELTQRPRGYEV